MYTVEVFWSSRFRIDEEKERKGKERGWQRGVGKGKKRKDMMG